MPRSRMEPGSHGEITYHDLPDGRVRGTVIFRRVDGSYGKLRSRAASRARARRTLVEAVGEEYEAAHPTGEGLTPDSLFIELAHEYMEHVAFTGDQRDTTRHENRRLIEKKISPLMGALALREIKASTILRVYKAIHRETPRQADTCKALISQICSYAVMNDLMIANPAREVKSVKKRPKPIYAPDAIELDQFRAIIRDHQNRDDRMGPRPSDLLADVVDLILATGARVSEAVGLKWQFVDLESERPSITIAGKIVDSKGQPKHYEDYLKSESGWRCISVPVELLPMLRRRRLTSGGNEFVFHTRTGAPSGTQDVHRSMRRVREWAHLDEELVPHALRKSAVTVVADALGIEGAAQFAGHKRSRVTEQYYAKRAVQAPDTSMVLGSLQRPRPETVPVVNFDRRRSVR